MPSRFGAWKPPRKKGRKFFMENEKMTHILEMAETDAAKKLEITQRNAAIALEESQCKAAAALLDANQAAAIALQSARKEGLEDLKDCENKEAQHRHDLEHVVSWMGGEYSPLFSARDIAIESDHATRHGTGQKTALDLKENQEKSADGLKNEQARTAALLKEQEENHASSLKTEQEDMMAAMRERQTILSLKIERQNEKPAWPEKDS